MDKPEDMGWLAENACRELAAAICPHITDPQTRVHEALRRFMWEAKRSHNPAPQTPSKEQPRDSQGEEL